jgi:hypothetical protein
MKLPVATNGKQKAEILSQLKLPATQSCKLKPLEEINLKEVSEGPSLPFSKSDASTTSQIRRIKCKVFYHPQRY